MSGIGDTAAVIKTTILTVANVGVVFDYQPYPAAEWDKFIATFTSTIGGVPRLRAFTVQYLGERRVPRTIGGTSGAIQTREIDWLVRAHWGLDDPTTDLAFRDKLEEVCDAIDRERGLNGVAGATDHDPVDVSLPERGAPILLGDIVCHYAEITFTSYHEQSLNLS